MISTKHPCITRIVEGHGFDIDINSTAIVLIFTMIFILGTFWTGFRLRGTVEGAKKNYSERIYVTTHSHCGASVGKDCPNVLCHLG